MSKPKGACTHEPVTELEHFKTTETIGPGKVGWSYWSKQQWYCAKCKRWLKAKWYPLESAP